MKPKYITPCVESMAAHLSCEKLIFGKMLKERFRSDRFAVYNAAFRAGISRNIRDHFSNVFASAEVNGHEIEPLGGWAHA